MKTSLAPIGRRTVVHLPDIGVYSAVAKVDTGAYSSSLHAENIRLETDEDGTPILKYEIPMAETGGIRVRLNATKDFFVKKVRSSNGLTQERFGIWTPVIIRGVRFLGVFTLADRAKMRHSLLIGRKLIRARFVVDVGLDESKDSPRLMPLESPAGKTSAP